jgi:hypothetical protein
MLLQVQQQRPDLCQRGECAAGTHGRAQGQGPGAGHWGNKQVRLPLCTPSVAVASRTSALFHGQGPGAG